MTVGCQPAALPSRRYGSLRVTDGATVGALAQGIGSGSDSKPLALKDLSGLQSLCNLARSPLSAEVRTLCGSRISGATRSDSSAFRFCGSPRSFLRLHNRPYSTDRSDAMGLRLPAPQKTTGRGPLGRFGMSAKEIQKDAGTRVPLDPYVGV